MKLILTFLFGMLVSTGNAQSWVSEAYVNFGEIELFSYKDKLFVGGYFTFIDGIPARGIAYWDNKNWKSYAASGLPYISFRAFATYNDELIAFGNKLTFPQSREFIKYNELENTWEPLPNSQVSRYAGNGNYEPGIVTRAIEYKGELYIAGEFDLIGDKPVKNFARWNGVEWLQVSDSNGDEIQTEGITAFEIYKNELIITGIFLNSDSNTIERIVSYNGEKIDFSIGELITTGTAKPFDLEEFKGELYVACKNCFVSGDDQAYRLVKWNGLDWEGIESLDLFGSEFRALKKFSDYLMIGSGSYRNFTFIFNGTSIQKIDQKFNYSITSFQEHDKQLFAVGGVGVDSIRNGIARLGKIEINPETVSRCNYFPNPTNNEFMISYEVLENTKTIISFYNVSGVLVNQESFSDLKGVYLRRFDLVDFPSGIYAVKIQTKGFSESKIIIKK